MKIEANFLSIHVEKKSYYAEIRDTNAIKY